MFIEIFKHTFMIEQDVNILNDKSWSCGHFLSFTWMLEKENLMTHIYIEKISDIYKQFCMAFQSSSIKTLKAKLKCVK